MSTDGNPIVPVDVVQGIVQQLSTVSPELNRMGLPPTRIFVVHEYCSLPHIRGA